MMWLCIMCSNILHVMQVRPSPFFRLASNAFPDIGSVDRIEKKTIKKKIIRSLGVGGLVPQHICGTSILGDPGADRGGKGKSKPVTDLADMYTP